MQDSTTTTTTTQQHQRKELRILSHNLWCHYVMRSPDKLERMQEFMKILEDMQRNESRQYDVLILQEVFAFKAFSSDALKWDAPKQHVIKEAERLGFIYKADDGDKCPPLFGQTSGLLVLSKYPILSLREFLWRTWTDFGTGKGALHCVIDFDNTPVHIVCVHLDAHSSAQRTTQVAEIKNQILKPLAFAAAEQQQQQQSPSPSPHSNFFSVPLIIAGDFNIPSHTQEYEAMMQMLNQFEDDANNNNNKNNNNTSPDMQKIRDVFADEHPQTFRNFAGKCIDHVLISPHWEVVARRVEDFQYKASNNTPAASPIAAASPAFSPIPPPSSPTTTTTTATATATATTISGPVVHTPSGLDTKIVSDHLGLSVTLRIRC